MGESVFTAFGPPIVNESGTAVFIADASPSFPGAGLYRRSIGGETVRIVSLFGSVGGFPHGLFSIEPDTIMLNDAGHVAFVGNFSNGSGAPLNGEWLIRYREKGLEILIQPGDPAPGGPGTLSNPRKLAFNGAGEIAFITDIAGAGDVNDGIFLTSPGGLIEIARDGLPSPHGDGEITGFHHLSLGDDGAVSFSYFTNSSALPVGIARGDGTNLELVLGPGQRVNEGILNEIALNPMFNESGHVLCRATLQTDKSEVDSLYVADDQGLRKVVAQYEPRPQGGIFEYGFTPIALDDDGRVTFTSPHGGGPNDRGVYVHDGNGIQLTAQVGDHAPGYQYWETFWAVSPLPGARSGGQAAILGRLDGFVGYDGLWATDTLGNLHEVARLDHPFEYAPGMVYLLLDLQVRTTSHGAATGYAIMNDAREIVFSASIGNIGGLYAAILDPADCNDNGVPDAIEIDADPSLDEIADGVLDECQYSCPADLSGQFGNPDATVNAADLLALLQAWGYCDFPCPKTSCPADIANDDCQVNLADLLVLLSAWGDCR